MKEAVRRHLEQFRQEVEEAGNQLRGRKMPEVTEELFGLYEKNGNRLLYENVYFPRRKYLATFGLLSIWYGRKEDLEMLEYVIRDICQEKTWALPAHVERSEEDWEKTVDLFASETGHTLSELSWVLKDQLSEETRTLIREKVLERVIDSYLAKPEGGWRWEHFKNNWAAVCAGSIGSAAIYLLDQADERRKVCLERVLRDLDTYLEGMKDDGTCPEGLSYFTYGMTYYVGFAELLYRDSEGKIDLMANPLAERTARFQQLCYYPGGVTVSFSDGMSHDKYRMGLTCYLALRYPGVEIPDVSAAMGFNTDSCFRFMGLYREDLWCRRYLEEAEEKTESEAEKEAGFHVLPSAQWVVAKAGNGAGMGVKGGHNGESHNHNDVGNFFYLAGGEMFITDLGCGEYTKDYFHEKRYTIFCNRSLGHNVPLIGGKEQLEGEEYHAERFETDEEKMRVEIEFASAYPAGTAKKLERHLTWNRDGVLNVEDYFQVPETEEILENLVTQIEPEITGEGELILKGKQAVVRLKAEGCGEFQVTRECFMNHFGVAEDVWRIDWKVETEAGRAVSRFVVETVGK